jgi:parallel beta-helix repeat protein
MKRSLGIVAALALTVGMAVAGAVPAGAATLRVVRPGRSIQAAINSAGANGSIIVKPGVYHENVTITKDGVNLVGFGATLLPPTTPAPNICNDLTAPAVDAICVLGNATLDPTGTPIVTTPVKNVKVTGFTIKNFTGIGIFVVGATGTKITDNRAINNGAYGIWADTSSNTLIEENVIRGSSEAGIYVGDSPQANATVIENESSGNQFGIFVRSAEHGTIVGNRLHDNCVGVLFLADSPGPAGAFKATGNVVTENEKFCPGTADSPLAVSGIGFAIAGGHDVTLTGNRITDNNPSGMVLFSGGVVVATLQPPGAPPATAPTNNVVTGNVIRDNKPDIFWDSSGTGNVFKRNLCRTSSPVGLCP